MVLHARVKDGRYVIDEPAHLPEGSIIELMPVDHLADMDPGEREALEASIARGLAEADRGEGIPADEFLRRLRAK